MVTQMSPREFREADGVNDWRVVGDGACAHYRTGSFDAGIRFVTAIGDVLDARCPDVDLRPEGVTLRLVTMSDEIWGLTDHDVATARQISEVASEMGVAAEPSAVQAVQVTIGAHDVATIMPFWKAVLGYDERGEEDLVDPHRRNAPFWFQELSRPRPARNRIHIDVFVPVGQAEARVEAAIAAGGQMLDDSHAPEWWSLADPVGNVADVAIVEGRD